MNRNIFFHENNSVKADYRLKKDGRSGEELSFLGVYSYCFCIIKSPYRTA